MLDENHNNLLNMISISSHHRQYRVLPTKLSHVLWLFLLLWPSQSQYSFVSWGFHRYRFLIQNRFHPYVWLRDVSDLSWNYLLTFWRQISQCEIHCFWLPWHRCYRLILVCCSFWRSTDCFWGVFTVTYAAIIYLLDQKYWTFH